MTGSGTSGNKQDDGIDGVRYFCPRQTDVEPRKMRPGMAPAVRRSVQRRQDLGQTNSQAIEVAQRDEIFGRQGQPMGGEGCREDPVVGVYARESAWSREQRNQFSWSVLWLL